MRGKSVGIGRSNEPVDLNQSEILQCFAQAGLCLEMI
jgi:hypothetical protein